MAIEQTVSDAGGIRAPRRIQLHRAKGWRKPVDAVVVARPTKWGNPFTIDGCLEAGLAETEIEARARCVTAYRDWLAGQTSAPGLSDDGEDRRRRILDDLGELAGHDLACWCKPGDPCHADVLLELANKNTDG